MSDELKPCPFCGGEPFLTGITISSAAPFARCGTCYAEVPGKNDDDSSQRLSAIKVWNTRTHTPLEVLDEVIPKLCRYGKHTVKTGHVYYSAEELDEAIEKLREDYKDA